MPDLVIIWIAVGTMLVLGIGLAAWPQGVQRLAIRYAARSRFTGVLAPFVQSEGYVGMCRVIGGLFIFLACFTILGLALM